MPNDLETTLTDAVIARLSPDADPRFRRIMQSLIRHVHDFVRDVELTEEEWQLRAKLRADAEGRFRFRTILPTSYPVPTDGPVGLVLNRMGRHPMRPAHLHFMVSAPGYETVVTHLFVKGDPYLESDVVFGVKDSLIVDFVRNDSEADAQKLGLTAPFYSAVYDFVLRPAGEAKQAARAASDAV